MGKSILLQALCLCETQHVKTRDKAEMYPPWLTVITLLNRGQAHLIALT